MILGNWQSQIKGYKQNFCINRSSVYTEVLLIIRPHQLVTSYSYEITLIASTRALARLRARFASIICLLPSAFLTLASAILRVC